MSFDVKAELLSTIAKTDDAIQRAHLMLMLGVLQRVEELLATERLQVSVLNKLAGVHDEHHKWIADRIEVEKLAVQNARKKISDIAFSFAEKLLYLLVGAACYAVVAGWPVIKTLTG